MTLPLFPGEGKPKVVFDQVWSLWPLPIMSHLPNQRTSTLRPRLVRFGAKSGHRRPVIVPRNIRHPPLGATLLSRSMSFSKNIVPMGTAGRQFAFNNAHREKTDWYV